VVLATFVVGLVLNLAFYAYVWSAQPGLPELMPLHYNGAGVVDLIGRPAELMKLPAIGTMILLLNGAVALALRGRERPAAMLMLVVACAVQLVFGSGAWVLVSKAAGE
jgi:uncharacterized membrane protein